MWNNLPEANYTRRGSYRLESPADRIGALVSTLRILNMVSLGTGNASPAEALAEVERISRETLSALNARLERPEWVADWAANLVIDAFEAGREIALGFLDPMRARAINRAAKSAEGKREARGGKIIWTFETGGSLSYIADR